MAGTSGPYAALDAFAQQGEVAQQVEELVARQLVVAAQFEVVQVAEAPLPVRLLLLPQLGLPGERPRPTEGI